ncbi:1-acyl-sn-glycerol-3-phosphate acyltransferase [Angustibacter sp. Root456]|uniref:lysophospholipid acyltransferase family protein n=1 Tax=Angustibacter sp. Root456 TaxID=1736539 RepID=UPI0006F59C3C|nr:lysophospholipid acyltransferase family protein [Angustibacter sp. Root456]KQX61695.1 glycerol acyltransferase [Angustibacter sp. Root456]
MADLVYPPVIATCRLAFKLLGMKVEVTGAEHVPATGGAVLASNHVSYLDFIFAGLAGVEAGRLPRFMAKDSVFRDRIGGPLMRGMHHIPVDRDAGSASFRQALGALKAGEVVGIFPEATISRSFTVKECKSGAVRLAQASGTPLLPVAVWGGQRMFTKGRKKDLTSRGRHVLISVGEPIAAPKGADGDELTRTLRTRLQELLDDLQRRTPEQPQPGEDAWWHPAHLGGAAPTPEQAEALDAADREARGRRPEPPTD